MVIDLEIISWIRQVSTNLWTEKSVNKYTSNIKITSIRSQWLCKLRCDTVIKIVEHNIISQWLCKLRISMISSLVLLESSFNIFPIIAIYVNSKLFLVPHTHLRKISIKSFNKLILSKNMNMLLSLKLKFIPQTFRTQNKRLRTCYYVI